MITAEEVLTVLNGMRPVELADLEFAVAVEPAAESWCNQLQRMVPGESWWPFSRGEVVVLDVDSGREPFGEGRKPSKWDLGFEYFDTLAEAVACRERVLAPVVSQETTAATDGGAA